MSKELPQYRIQKVIDFNPTWLDENGWMTKVPGPNFLSSLNLPEGFNRAVGVYLSPRTFNNRRPDDEELLSFVITTDQITQYLTPYQYARIKLGEVTISSKHSGFHQRWNSFYTAEGELVWRLVSEMKHLEYDQESFLVPATMVGLFYALDKRLKRAWDKIEEPKASPSGTERLHEDDWDYRLFSTANSFNGPSHKNINAVEILPMEAWKYLPTGVRSRELWIAVMGYTQGVLLHPFNEELRVERKEQILYFIELALALKAAVE